MTWTTRPRSEANGLAAITAGDGPTILLLHGVGLRAEAWNRQIDALSADHRVIAPDMPGHGRSVASTSSMGLQDYADAMLQWVLGPALIVGHSMGAMIALNLAARFPDRVLGVAALNAIHKRSAAATAAVRARADRLDGQTIADPGGTLTRWFGDVASAERDACETWLRDVTPAGYKAAYSVFAHSDGPGDAALSQLTCPAVFMTGEEEPNSTPQMSRDMARLALDGRAIVVKGAAHMMPMTHAEDVNAALLELAQEVFS